MINYLGRFIPNLASVMRPMSELLKSDTAWTWGPLQQTAFTKVKEIISSDTVLAFYDPKIPTVVCADASSYGIGGVLMQGPSHQLRPVGICSRTLTETEVRYAQIEKECLAAVWTCERLSRYLVGLPSFQLLTDHKPLVPLINQRDLYKTPLRCQRLLMRFNPQAEHVPGKQMVVADTLSRSPCKLGQEPNTVEDVQAFVDLVESTRPATSDQLKRIRETSISKEIKAKVESCQFCQENQPSQRKEPLMTTDLPDRPWQKVSTDLLELASEKYLVVMDYHSRFIEILSLVETTSQVVIQKLKSMFARWGIPEELIRDNGTQFKSLHFDEFKAKFFCV